MKTNPFLAACAALLLLCCTAPAQTRYDTSLIGGHWSVITHNGRLALAVVALGDWPVLEQVGPLVAPPGAPPGVAVSLAHQFSIVIDRRPCAEGASVLWHTWCGEFSLGAIPSAGMFTTNRPFTIQHEARCLPYGIAQWSVGYWNPAMASRCAVNRPEVVLSVFEVGLR